MDIEYVCKVHRFGPKYLNQTYHQKSEQFFVSALSARAFPLQIVVNSNLIINLFKSGNWFDVFLYSEDLHKYVIECFTDIFPIVLKYNSKYFIKKYIKLAVTYKVWFGYPTEMLLYHIIRYQCYYILPLVLEERNVTAKFKIQKHGLLEYAVDINKIQMVHMLIQHLPDVNVMENIGRFSPVEIAKKKNYTKILKLLQNHETYFEYMDENTINKDILEHWLEEQGNVNNISVDYVIKQFDDILPNILAVYPQKLDDFIQFCKEKDIWYSVSSEKVIFPLISSFKDNILKSYIISKGININNQPKLNDDSLLTFAIKKQNLSTIKIILENVKDITICEEKDNISSIAIAISYYNLDIITYLFNHTSITINILEHCLTTLLKPMKASTNNEKSFKMKCESIIAKRIKALKLKQAQQKKNAASKNSRSNKNKKKNKRRRKSNISPKPTMPKIEPQLIPNTKEKKEEKIETAIDHIDITTINETISDIIQSKSLLIQPIILQPNDFILDTSNDTEEVIIIDDNNLADNNEEFDGDEESDESENEIDQVDNSWLDSIHSFDKKPWELVISIGAKKDWYKLDSNFKELVHDSLVKLATFGPAYNKCNKISNKFVQHDGMHLFSLDCTKGILLICEQCIDVSILKSTDENIIFSDIIRIWSITKLDKQEDELKKIVKSYQKGKKSSIQHNLTALGEHDPKNPRLYVKQDDNNSIPTSKEEEIRIFPPAAYDGGSYTIEKFYNIDDNMTRNVKLSNEEQECFFRICDHEINIVQSKEMCSTILLGRSGTGKTTCALWKLWNIYKAYWDECSISEPKEEGKELGESCHLHQVFVTANSLLKSEVDTSFTKMKNSNTFGRKSLSLLKESNEETKLPSHLLNEINIKEFPLFLTSRQFIIMIDGTLENSFFSRKQNKELKNPDIVYKPNQEMKVKNYSLSSLSNVDNFFEDNAQTSNKKITNCIEIDFNYFKNTIWPNITSNKKYSCSLVWKEIFSYIKGSLEVMFSKNRENGFLTKKEYVDIGNKLAPNFNGKREEIYDIFISYRKYISNQRHKVKLFDWTDVIHHCIRELLKKPYSGIPIHYITYDEVQDATQIELYLYFLIIKNPNQFFFTGDTCQTIARGVGFRFKDLRSIFYHHNKDNEYKTGQIKTGVPQIKYLLRNYRSHRGITNLASSVIELLKFFFPDSYDDMDPDEGIFDGPKPLVLLSDKVRDLYPLLFDYQGDEIREFGANQVIIVRNQEVKKNLPDELRYGGLCLTVFECKGLEFNDVLLYNFFTDSQFINDWKFIKNYNDECQKQSHSNEYGISTKSYTTDDDYIEKRNIKLNSAKYRSLCDELKYLYVAITRARCNVWFYDNTTSKAIDPALEYFTRRNMVKVLNTNDIDNQVKEIKEQASNSEFKQFAQQSTKEQWEKRGILLKEKELWEAAAYCFKRSNNTHEYNKAAANNLMDKASSIINETGKKTKQVTLYLSAAAKLFLLEGNSYSAGICSFHAGNKQDSIKCFKIGGNYLQVADVYMQIKKFRKASEYYIKSNNIEKALKLLVYNKQYSILAEYLTILKDVNVNLTWNDIINTYTIDSIFKESLFIACQPHNAIQLAKALIKTISPNRISVIFRKYYSEIKEASEWFLPIFDVDVKKSYKDDIRNFFYQSGSYEDALNFSSLMEIQQYYQTLRAILEFNKIKSTQSNQLFIKGHITKCLANNNLANQSRVNLIVSYTYWLQNANNTNMDIELLFINKSIDNLAKQGSIIDPICMKNYINQRILLEKTNLEQQSETKSIITDRYLDILQQILDHYLPSLLGALTNTYTPKFNECRTILLNYFMIKKNSADNSFLLTKFSLIQNYFTGEDFDCGINYRKVIFILIKQLLNTYHELQSKVEELFPFKHSEIKNFIYNMNHYKVLSKYKAHINSIKNFNNKFYENGYNHMKVNTTLCDFSSIPRIVPDYNYDLIIAIGASYYPPPLLKYWECRDYYKGFLQSCVPDILNMENNSRIKKNDFKFSYKSYYKTYILCQIPAKIHVPIRDSTLLLPLGENTIHEEEIKKLPLIIKSERAWQMWEPVYSFSLAKAYLLRKNMGMQQYLNVLEINSMRFLTYFPFEHRIFADYTCFIKHFKHSDDYWITPNTLAKDKYTQTTKFYYQIDKTYKCILEVFQQHPTFTQKINQQIRDRFGILYATLLLNFFDRQHKMEYRREFVEFHSKFAKIRLDLSLFSNSVSITLQNIFNHCSFESSISYLDTAIRDTFGSRLTQFSYNNTTNKWVHSFTCPTLAYSAEEQSTIKQAEIEQRAKLIIFNFTKALITKRNSSQTAKLFPLSDTACPECSQPIIEHIHEHCEIPLKQQIRVIYHKTTLPLVKRMKNMRISNLQNYKKINAYIDKYYETSIKVQEEDIEEFNKLNTKFKEEIEHTIQLETSAKTNSFVNIHDENHLRLKRNQ